MSLSSLYVEVNVEQADFAVGRVGLQPAVVRVLSRIDGSQARHLELLHSALSSASMLRNALRPAARSLCPRTSFTHAARLAAQETRKLSTTSVRLANTKTLPNILAGGPAPPVVVKNITSQGLQLASGLVVPGPCIFLEGEVFLWDVPPADTWATLDAKDVRAMFEVFEVVVPRPGEFLQL